MDVDVTDLEMRFPSTTSAPGALLLHIPEWRVPAAAKVCLTGASGTGKTTLLHLLAGLLTPSKGTIRMGDVCLSALGEGARDAFRARHVGLVFQTARLLPGLSAVENVALAASLGGLRRAAARMRARELLERVELASRADALPRQLSVGEAQRVAVARAVASKPGVILADEPTASLDPVRRDAIIALLRDVADTRGSTLILVSHESEVHSHFDQVLPIEQLAHPRADRGVR